jgi:putative ATPase
MPAELSTHHYYEPTSQGQEKAWQQRLAAIRQWHQQHQSNDQPDDET